MQDNQHTWFIVSGITGFLFIIWGSIASDARPLIPGDHWLVVPGCMLLIISISGILEGMITDMRILKYFSGLTVKEINVTQAAEDLNMDVDSFRQRILALKMNGKLAISFLPATGDIVKSDLMNEQTCSFCANPTVTKDFCPVCGTKKLVNKTK